MRNKQKILKEKKAEDTEQFIYRGKSMHPTFKQGHTLYARPVLRDLVPGDVIIFFDSEKQMNIVHRVVNIEGDLIQTRGDNNPEMDSKPISFESVLGKVMWTDQLGQLKPVHGGQVGLLHLRTQSFRNKITILLFRLISPFYQWIKKHGIVAKIWHPKIKKISLLNKSGKIIKYVHKKQTVAIWDPATGYYSYRHPYDLVLQLPIKEPLNELK